MKQVAGKAARNIVREQHQFVTRKSCDAWLFIGAVAGIIATFAFGALLVYTWSAIS